MYVHPYVYTYMYTHINIYTYTYTCYVSTDVYIYIYIYVERERHVMYRHVWMTYICVLHVAQATIKLTSKCKLLGPEWHRTNTMTERP